MPKIDWVDLYLKPTGRIGQKEFWIGILGLIVVGIIVNIVVGRIPVVGTLASLALLYPAYCVLCSRLADMGKAPLLASIGYIIIGVYYLFILLAELGIGLGALGALVGLPVLMVGGVICLVLWIWAAITKGDPGPNAYGPPPADPEIKTA